MDVYKIVLLFCCLQLSLVAQQKEDIVSIKINSPSFKNKMHYLAGYYGKYTVLLDSAKASNNGELLFKNTKKYTQGIYMLVNSDKNIVTEFIIDEKQQYSIALNITNPEKSTIVNSEVNTRFFEFNALLKQNNIEIKKLVEQLENAPTKNDSIVIKHKISNLNNTLNNYKNNFTKEHPNNILSLLFNLSKPVENYFNNEKFTSKKDSLTFLKDAYFKEINLSDNRLLRNPFLEKKINTYFDLFVPKTPKDLTFEITDILNRTGDKNGEMFSYLSIFFVNNYVNAKIMGNDRVFINIYNTFFKNKTYNWLTTKQQIFLNTSNLQIKDNLIGNKAKNLFMTSINEQKLNLYNVNAPYTIVIFWDPSCGHCVKELPKINKLYTSNLKNKGVKIYAVNINPELKKEWKEFIFKEKLNDWIHVYPSSVVYGNYSKEDTDFQTLYNVNQTPVIYLLDKNKIFRAKKISVEKFKFIINKLENK
ncbi:TlpA family protein disulfide reductase [Lutibacter citreus]|uniref:TlpA family protein disulfide reductase n=1 Tax=Lutibacter citreus TaxID=2138210 RepID=UPI000DBEA961|nr:TlpA disulfide reductase family protein [Lutibacter citreus]